MTLCRFSAKLALLVALVCAVALLFVPATHRGDLGVSATEPVHGVPETALMGLGDRMVLDTGYAFESDDPDIASVSSAGVITARGEGRCRVSVWIDGREEPLCCNVRVLPAPEMLAVKAPDYRMGVGEALALLPRAMLENGDITASTFTFSTSNRRVLTVNGSGVVTAHSSGKATITVSTYNGISASLEIAVGSSPAWVRFECNEVSMGLGEERTLEIQRPKNSAGAFDVKSSDEKVVQAQGGRLVAVGAGRAVVTVTTYNGMTDICVVRVTCAPVGVRLECDECTLGVGESISVEARLTGSFVSGSLEWSSDDLAVARVGDDGTIYAVGEGQCVITCATYNGRAASLDLRVLPAPEAVYSGVSSVSMGLDETWTFSPIINVGAATTFSFTSSNKKVARVNAAGMVTAMTQGSATITARSHNGLTSTVKVTVKKRPKWVSLPSEPLELCVDDSMRVGAKLSSGAGAVLRYSVADVNVAWVDSKGRVLGRAPGYTTLTVETYNGKTAECGIHVYIPAGSIQGEDEMIVTAGEETIFPVVVLDEMGGPYAGSVDIDVADPDMLEIASGIMRPLKSGGTYVTVTSHELSRRFQVTVKSYASTHTPIIAAHRGGTGHGAENTLDALRGAWEDGAEYVEVDVRATKDGALVLMHDSNIARVAGRGGRVSSMTLAQLKDIDIDGSRICTLEEALEFLRDTDMTLLLEFKTTSIEEACVQAVARAGMEERVVYISFYMGVLNRVRELQPNARLGYLFGSAPVDPAALALNMDVEFMLAKYKLITEEFVSQMHLAGVKVGVWTANSAKNLSSVKAAGVDLIITDYVARARAVAK